jgi:hypothetical protein
LLSGETRRIGQKYAGSSAGKNKEFTQGVVDHHRGQHIAAEGVGGEDAEPFDEGDHQQGAKIGADAGDGVKEQDFDDDMVSAALENPENVGDVGHHVGHDKGDVVADHRVACPGGVIDGHNGHFEQADEMVFFLQCRKNFPADEVKEGDMCERSKSSRQSILKELKNCRVVKVHKWSSVAKGSGKVSGYTGRQQKSSVGQYTGDGKRYHANFAVYRGNPASIHTIR